VPSALVAALSAPIREVASLVGPGISGVDPAATLGGVADALAGVSAAADRAWLSASPHWTGAAAATAADFVASASAAASSLALRADGLGAGTEAAAAAVARAHTRLQAIVEGFEARAAALEPHLESPGTAEELLAEAQRALDEAIAVVDELQAELDGQAATMTAAPAAPAPTAPAGFSGLPALGSGGSGLGSGLSDLSGLGSGGFGSSPSGLGSGLGSGLAELAGFDRPEAAVALADPRTFGDGVAVRLPDGSTAMAPNAVAASAVRHALTQLGVPYDWGGTTPGVGLDCSGLTQWAYHEAGLGIPRLAQDQDVGAAVDAGSLRPGDLAVWDGHVAMIVGNGIMIEAGDPVQLSPIRTDNAGQGFQGFWRPTA
jgi:peptidoglycan DL-endopeptidase CwlO